MQLFSDLVTVSILKYLGLRFTLHIKMLNVKGTITYLPLRIAIKIFKHT